ncbi:DUF6880 family protein [Psychrobacter sp. DM8]|uniref:DUF6880 family protein n=1 Tax=unclassified Psychrobacter TaxID=196806 RepID=UPI003F509C97
MLDDQQKACLSKLPKATLVNFVADVQGMDKLLDKKIERLLLQSDKPKLIKKLTSTLKGLRRRRKSLNFWEYSDFVTELHYLVDDVMSLYPEQAQACLELLELFIDSTEPTFERIDDSNGDVIDIYQNLTSLWLQVATRCYEQELQAAGIDEKDIVRHAWMEKVKSIACDNDYGTKDHILRGVDQLFTSIEIQGLIEDYKYDYQTLLNDAFNDFFDGSKPSFDEQNSANSIHKKYLETALTDLAWALGDIDVFEEMYLYLNTHRVFSLYEFKMFITFMLEQDAYHTALRYLTKDWQDSHHVPETECLHWLNRVYAQQNNVALQLDVLNTAFELEPTPALFEQIMAIATPAQQADLRKKTYELADQQDDVIIAIGLWLEVKETTRANQVAIARQDEFDDMHYTTLTRWLKQLPDETHLIRVVIYRSLLNDILENDRSMAYGHAARYYKHLVKLDAFINRSDAGYMGLDHHKNYVDSIQKKHGKKYSFWDRVES